MGKDPKKDESKEPREIGKKALTWRERMDPDTAGTRWDLPSYKEMDERKSKR